MPLRHGDGLAEFVAEPGLSHEWRAARLTALFGQIELALDDAGHPAVGALLNAAATRLLSDDGAYEPDASLFVGRAAVEAALQEEGWIDSRAGHPLPALVAEVDRSVKSSGKLAPYFRMGVREAWTWSRRDGARIWVASPESPGGFRAADRSTVLPGLDRERLDRLLAHGSAATTARLARELARDVAAAIAAQGALACRIARGQVPAGRPDSTRRKLRSIAPRRPCLAPLDTRMSSV